MRIPFVALIAISFVVPAAAEWSPLLYAQQPGAQQPAASITAPPQTTATAVGDPAPLYSIDESEFRALTAGDESWYSVELPAEVRAWYRNPDGSCVQCSIGMCGADQNCRAAASLLWSSEFGPAVRGGSSPPSKASRPLPRPLAFGLIM